MEQNFSAVQMHNSTNDQSASSTAQENLPRKSSGQSIFRAAFSKQNYKGHLTSPAVRLSYLNSILGAGAVYYGVHKMAPKSGAAALSAYTTAIFAWFCTYFMINRRDARNAKMNIADDANFVEKTLTDDYTHWGDD
uniref:Uncharacterized protein n=1 Tax=Romanomermis culicivorax TaxID=13658 RepID=A0A915K893_ROMCU